MSNAAENLPEDPAVLKAMIAALQAENAQMSATLRAHDQLIQMLRLRIAKLKKQAFGTSAQASTGQCVRHKLLPLHGVAHSGNTLAASLQIATHEDQMARELGIVILAAGIGLRLREAKLAVETMCCRHVWRTVQKGLAIADITRLPDERRQEPAPVPPAAGST
jgi:hypothetical protein